MRKSSVHFKQVANASVSIAHATRTEETEPAYLLPKEHRLGNVIVPGSMSNIELGLEFTRAKDSMTGQAKARGSSPFWEGVVVLDGTDIKAQTVKLQEWKKEYEKATGHRVLHIAIHGDEGFIDSKGKPEYNMHAHVTVNRLNEKNRVIKLGRSQLSKVQDLTAKALGMQRGETLEDRKGMRGRKHLNHREFRKLENEKRLDSEHNIEAIQTVKTDVSKARAEVVDLKAQIARLKAEYAAERAALKASGDATQKDYQALKVKHEAKDKTPAAVPAAPRPRIDQTKVRAIRDPGTYEKGGEFRRALEKAARDQSLSWDEVDWIKAEVDAARRLSTDSCYPSDYIFDCLVKLSPAQQSVAGDEERLRRECKPPAPVGQLGPDDDEPSPRSS